MKMEISVVMHMIMSICIHILMSTVMYTAMSTDTKTIIITIIRRQKGILTVMEMKNIVMEVKAIATTAKVTVMEMKVIATAMRVRQLLLIRMKHFCSTCWIIIPIMQQNWIRWHRSLQLTVMLMQLNRSAKQWTSFRRAIFT